MCIDTIPAHYDLCVYIHGLLFILMYVVFSLNYCFAAVVLIATNEVEYRPIYNPLKAYI